MPVSSAPPTSPGAIPAARSPAPAPRPAAWTVEPLQGWHLPLLDDPAFLPLQPLLQRCLLLAVPERLITAVAAHRALVPHVLVAWQRDGRGRQRALGLIVSRRLNRSGSCWQVEHLCPALHLPAVPAAPSRQEICAALLREALQRGQGAASWIAVAASVDRERLAALREQGFQPQRTDQLWRWSAPTHDPLPALPASLQLLPLNRRTAGLHWHLEQACCPAPLRQVLDRRIDDLLDQSHGRGWMLVDPSRSEAVAGARLLGDHPGGGSLVELSVHPGWGHLLGPAAQRLQRALGRRAPPRLQLSAVGDADPPPRHAPRGAQRQGG
ncbi:MAG: hypothetical protein ACK55X_04605, partial [Synechococcaceae cyanobacterium]